eukprot:5496166-Alexandrium_andersonii.AAC.1
MQARTPCMRAHTHGSTHTNTHNPHTHTPSNRRAYTRTLPKSRPRACGAKHMGQESPHTPAAAKKTRLSNPTPTLA